MGSRRTISSQKTERPTAAGDGNGDCITTRCMEARRECCQKCQKRKLRGEPCASCVEESLEMGRLLHLEVKRPSRGAISKTTSASRPRCPPEPGPVTPERLEDHPNTTCPNCRSRSKRDGPCCELCTRRELQARNLEKRAWCDRELRSRAQAMRQLQTKQGRAYLELLARLKTEDRPATASGLLDAQLILDGEIASLRNLAGTTLDYMWQRLRLDSHRGLKTELYKHFQFQLPVNLGALFLTAPFTQIWSLSKILEALEKMEEAEARSRSVCLI